MANGDRLELAAVPPTKPQPLAAFDDAWIVAEASDLIVVNKPAGLMSEPTRWTDRLAFWPWRPGALVRSPCFTAWTETRPGWSC